MKTVIENHAKDDIRESIKWYNNQKKGLGNLFFADANSTIEKLKSNPFLFQIRYFEVHTAVLKKFPYMIHYYIDPNRKAIVIIAVLHTSRNPSVWFTRK